MRVLLVGLLVSMSVGLSGCAVQFDVGDENVQHHTSSCTVTTNGVTRECGEQSNMTFDPVHVDDTLSQDPSQPTASRYSFGVGTNASSSVRVTWSGTDGTPAKAGEPCVRLDGPTKLTRGACGGNNVNIVIGANALLQDQLFLDASNLRPGQYSLSIEAPRGIGDVHVLVHVDY